MPPNRICLVSTGCPFKDWEVPHCPAVIQPSHGTPGAADASPPRPSQGVRVRAHLCPPESRLQAGDKSQWKALQEITDTCSHLSFPHVWLGV